MSTNGEFVSQLRAGRCRFFLADFHVHSAASFDVREGDRFRALPEEMQFALKDVKQGLPPIEYENAVLAAFPPSEFLRLLVNQRETVVGEVEPEIGSDWAIVGITDHNVCEYSCEVAAIAFAKRNEFRLIVLPGIELDVVYPIPGTNTTTQIHVLCLFQPNTKPSEVAMAIRDANGGKTWKTGAPAEVASLCEFVQGLRKHQEWPAICIAAHVGSKKGAQKETRNTILSHIEAELVRLEGEKKSGREPDLESIDRRIAELESQREPGRVAIEVLRIIGNCGFDALQVASTADAVHYRRLHRFRDEHGRAVPIVASDAHSPSDVFRAGGYIPHLKLPALSAKQTARESFSEIRRALRFGETRFSSAAQEPAQYWIAGIEVTPDAFDAANFWPSGDAGKSSGFVLPFSRNLNTLIGGRGSGKSATIEAIAFVAEPDLFSKEGQKKVGDRGEFYSRAEATLSGCRVRLCWQFTGGDLAKDLPKRAMVADRYFDPSGRQGAVEYTDANDKQLVPQQIPSHPVQIFRLGEIEKQAGPSRLRSLFDQICGAEIQALDADIDAQRKALATQRLNIVNIAGRMQSSTKEGSSLREFAKRTQLYHAVNTPELKATYERIDDLEAATSIVGKVDDAISQHLNSETIGDIKLGVAELCDAVRRVTVNDDGSIKPYLQGLADIFALADQDKVPACREKIETLVSQLAAEIKSLSDLVAKVKEEVSSNLVTARNELSEKGLPSGAKDREAKRVALTEAEEALKQYRTAASELKTTLAARSEMRSQLLKSVQRRSELRRTTGEQITNRLKADLDASVIRIEADAQPAKDKGQFRQWLGTNFRGADFKYQESRCAALLEDGLTPDKLGQLLMSEEGMDEGILVVKRASAAEGEIDSENAKMLALKCRAIDRLPTEMTAEEWMDDTWMDLPAEIRDGLLSVPGEGTSRVNAALELDEVVFDDVPQIRLNDRPLDPRASARPVDQLSPGQRCSAVLPILLLNGQSPLIIDQPEDNLDNRLIRQVIVNILASIKLRRQVIIATHNPNLPVLGDVESAVVLKGVGDKQCEVEQRGDLDSALLAHQLTEVMEGGREAFQYRHVIYSSHWDGSVHKS